MRSPRSGQITRIGPRCKANEFKGSSGGFAQATPFGNWVAGQVDVNARSVKVERTGSSNLSLPLTSRYWTGMITTALICGGDDCTVRETGTAAAGATPAGTVVRTW